MKNSLLTAIVLLSAFCGFSQATAFDVFGTATNPRSGPYALITLDTLENARTLSDLYARYPSSWVASYHSVMITTNCGGITQKAVSADDRLTIEQLAMLQSADANCRIEVEVAYIPENKLRYNPARELKFSLRMAPIHEAKYPGGPAALRTYLKEQIVDELSPATFSEITRTTAQWTVTADGRPTDVHLLQPSGNAAVDQLMLDAICNMPQWRPARDADGQSIAQDFQFTMGTDLLRCDFAY